MPLSPLPPSHPRLLLAVALAAIVGACNESTTVTVDMTPGPPDMTPDMTQGPPCGDGFCLATQVCLTPPCCFGDAGAGSASQCSDGGQRPVGYQPRCIDVPAACGGHPSCGCGFFPMPCDNACDNVVNGQLTCNCGI